MDTQDQRRPGTDQGLRPDEHYERPGLGSWVRRNSWLLVRLFIVMVFTFGASTTAANFSYGLQDDPVRLSAEQLRAGQLPPGTKLDDYVEITGAPDFGPDPEKPAVGVSARYSTAYYYFPLQETGDSLLIQQAQTPPDISDTGERVWRGQLATVGTVIFHDTTQRGLKAAGLPHDETIPVIETGDTPEYYRRIFPAYSAIIGLWVLSIVWLIWKKNKPFLGL